MKTFRKHLKEQLGSDKGRKKEFDLTLKECLRESFQDLVDNGIDIDLSEKAKIRLGIIDNRYEDIKTHQPKDSKD